VLLGNQSAFVRDDELTAAWNLFTPLLHQIDAEKIQPIPYKFGSRGPAESDRLIARYGYTRNAKYQWTPPASQ
jgi:glucose-6-phosphate 1-dehydrogenase